MEGDARLGLLPPERTSEARRRQVEMEGMPAWVCHTCDMLSTSHRHNVEIGEAVREGLSHVFHRVTRARGVDWSPEQELILLSHKKEQDRRSFTRHRPGIVTET